MGTLILTTDASLEVHTPDLLFSIPKAEALEGDRHFRLPATFSDLALDLPDHIPILITHPSILSDLAVEEAEDVYRRVLLMQIYISETG